VLVLSTPHVVIVPVEKPFGDPNARMNTKYEFETSHGSWNFAPSQALPSIRPVTGLRERRSGGCSGKCRCGDNRW
jgi:hypothetical protein